MGKVDKQEGLLPSKGPQKTEEKGQQEPHEVPTNRNAKSCTWGETTECRLAGGHQLESSLEEKGLWYQHVKEWYQHRGDLWSAGSSSGRE